MQVGFRFIAMVLIATLAGGAQACVALCGAPAVPVRAVAARPEKSSCHHCPAGLPTKSTPASETPCKQCQTATQDRLATERDQTVAKAALELSVTPLLDVLPSVTAPVRPDAVAQVPVHPPPGDRLHEFCLLLI
jgi:hypothetical protein